VILPAAANAPAAIGQHAAQSPGLGGALLALFAVLALIIGLAWLLKRLPGSSLRSNEQLRVVSSLALGQRERLLVVQVGQQQLLLGVTAQSITPLHTLADPLPAPATALASSPHLPAFAQLLRSHLRKDKTDAPAAR
jgi:flagellar protein FliO/FliZ